MTRPNTYLALLLCAALLGVATARPSASRGSAAPRPLCSRDFDLWTNVGNITLKLQTNFSALSTYVYTIPLFRTNSSLSAADEVATWAGHCSILSISYAPYGVRSFCNGDITFSSASGIVGTISAQGGLFDGGVTTSTPSVQSIVGGTGVFRGASGELTITTVPNPDTTPGALPFSKYSISLDRSPRCTH